MAGSIYDWSVTAADNDDADATINWLEGQLPGTVNGSSRAVMAAIVSDIKDQGGTVTTGGSANAQTATMNCSYTLATGRRIVVKAGFSNTAATTLNVNATSAKAVRKYTVGGEAAIAANDIRAGGIYILTYDAAANSAAGAWMLLNPTPGSFTGTIAIAGALSVSTTLSVGSTATFDNDIILTAAAGIIRNNTSDASDTAQNQFCGGGSNSTTRGAKVNVYGNEHATSPGDVDLAPGAVAGAAINAFGSIYPTSSITYDCGDGSLSWLNVATAHVIFPAAQDASSNANTLDDYEEGTWTPAMSFATPGTSSIPVSVAVGTYRKIGGSVVAQFSFLSTAITLGTASGNLQMTGWPFTPISTTNYTVHASNSFQGITKANFTNFLMTLVASSATATINASGSGQTAISVAVADIPDGGTLRFRGFVDYFAA